MPNLHAGRWARSFAPTLMLGLLNAYCTVILPSLHTLCEFLPAAGCWLNAFLFFTLRNVEEEEEIISFQPHQAD